MAIMKDRRAPTIRLLAGLAVTLSAVVVYSGYTFVQLRGLEELQTTAIDRNRVLQRGQRLDESVPGSGLGLSIVRDISKLYGGGLELRQSPLGGLSAVLDLPAIG